MNVLIDLVQSSGEFRCVICDFGFANFTRASNKTFVAGLATREDIGISIRYASPEVCRKDERLIDFGKKLTNYISCNLDAGES